VTKRYSLRIPSPTVQQNDRLLCSSVGVRRAVGNVVAGDELRRAYVAHWAALVRLCTLLIGDKATAEDVVQDVFIRARDRIGSLSEEDVYPYLRRGTINGWRNVLRHRRGERSAVAKLTDVGGRDPLTDVDERGAMWEQIVRLPPKQRAVVVLRFYEDLPDRTIAQLLGCTQITVRSQAKRALAKLREAIEA
jgi:RNA polymerase sigma-70 factor (sigma-E family)